MGKQIITVIKVEEHPVLSLDELCVSCGISYEYIHELVEFGIIEPRGISHEDWRFDAEQLRRIRLIMRLEDDLEINLAGAALVLDLLDEIEMLRSKVELLKKQVSPFR